MYILGPHQSGVYHGWRTSRNRVNRFYFTGMSDSYAAAWGDYTAMGVIAIAVYQSRHNDLSGNRGKGKRTDPMDRPRANGKRENPGTGFGENKWSPSKTVHFSPQRKPIIREFIKYEWRSTLCRNGIISCRKSKVRKNRKRLWNNNSREQDYAPFPPQWPFR